MLLVHNVVFVVWWLATVRSSVHHWRWLAAWAGMQGAIILLYLPWLRIAVKSITGWPSAGQAYELEPALLNVWRWLSVGHTLPLEEAGLALAGFGALLLVGLWPRPAKRWFGLTTCILYLALPIALIFALDLYKEAWLKFLIVVLAPAHVLIARGIENLVAFTCYVLRITFHVSRHTQHAARCFLLFACAVPIYPSLHNLYVNPAYARDDYRQIASDIKAAAGPDSAVILNAPNQWEVFTYYYPDRDVHPVPYRPGLDEVDAFLSPLVEQYERFFVLYWGEAESDPQRLVESWLANHAYKADERWVGRVRLATYGVAALPEAPDVTLEARFGEMLLLGGYALGDATPLPGDVLPVTLFWETAMPVTEPYKVSVQLLDETGQLVAQHDGEPGGGFAPTMTWQPGQVIADLHGVLIPPASSPGPYSLVLAVYHAHTGERLDATLDGKSIGDHLALSAVNVSSP